MFAHIILYYYTIFRSRYDDVERAAAEVSCHMPTLKSVTALYDAEQVLRFLIYGSTQNIDYNRFRRLLSSSSLGESVDENGVVKIRTAHPDAFNYELASVKHVTFPNPFLRDNISLILDFIDNKTII